MIPLRKPYQIILLFCGFFLFNCNGNDSVRNPQKPIPVETAAVIIESTASPVRASGVLVSAQEVKLSFKIGGIIRQMEVEEGEDVKEGQLLAVLDQSEIQAGVQTAESAYQKALRDYKRVKNLFEDSVATLEQKQNAETALEVAEANRQIALHNLKHSSIFAPSAGKIMKQLAEKNELVNSGQPVFIFGSVESDYRLRSGLTDRHIIRLRIGDSAAVTFAAYPGETFAAEVSQIAQAADPYTGTYEVELAVQSAGHNLMFGFVGDLLIFPSIHTEVFRIPAESLVEADGDRGTVYSVDLTDSTAQKIRVEIADILKNYIIVRSGLENIERVITSGSPYLFDGAVVKVIR
ncbi:MAG: efflux RND transporter periplasmic adaptor subunit [Calditrichaeota bacterium]|nr:MAG: efflux RND transporter periplasmic adaptor subunit [Calditrichota bacterium]